MVMCTTPLRKPENFYVNLSPSLAPAVTIVQPGLDDGLDTDRDSLGFRMDQAGVCPATYLIDISSRQARRKAVERAAVQKIAGLNRSVNFDEDTGGNKGWKKETEEDEDGGVDTGCGDSSGRINLSGANRKRRRRRSSRDRRWLRSRSRGVFRPPSPRLPCGSQPGHGPPG